MWTHRLSNIDPETRRGDCAECGSHVALKWAAGRHQWRCRKAWSKGKKRRRTQYRRRRLGITDEAIAILIQRQDGKCPICGRPLDLKRRTHLDHDHATGKVRGVLCGWCNAGLGYFADSVERLLAAVNYLSVDAQSTSA